MKKLFFNIIFFGSISQAIVGMEESCSGDSLAPELRNKHTKASGIFNLINTMNPGRLGEKPAENQDFINLLECLEKLDAQRSKAPEANDDINKNK